MLKLSSLSITRTGSNTVCHQLQIVMIKLANAASDTMRMGSIEAACTMSQYEGQACNQAELPMQAQRLLT